MGRPGQGEARADRRGSRRDSLVRRQLRELPARLLDRTPPPSRWASSEHRTRARHARLPAGRRAAPAVRDRRDCRRLPELRLRAARDAGGREHRDAAGQVRRRRRPPDLQDPQARRRRRDRPGRPGAALRPDRAAGARRRRVSRASCRSSSSATRCSRCGAPIGRRRAASASSTSATSTRSARRRWWSRPSCCRRPPTCSWRSASRTSRSSSITASC